LIQPRFSKIAKVRSLSEFGFAEGPRKGFGAAIDVVMKFQQNLDVLLGFSSTLSNAGRE
jgi:hypothetical protein